VYLAEDALSVVRERAETLARHRGLPLAEVNLHVITASRLRLDQPTDRSRLFETARRLRPRMLLLDPLVRLEERGRIQRGSNGWRLSDPSRASGSSDRRPCYAQGLRPGEPVPCSPP